MARKKNQIYEVEIKSKAILKEGQKSLITYFQGGNRKTIVKNAMWKYPQYTKPEDKPNISLTPISKREYDERVAGKMVTQKKHLVEARGHMDEVMGS